MPIILKQAEISYNDNGTYKGINAIAQRPTAQMISQVQAAGAETIAEIEQKIVDSQSAINNIESQKNTMIASIASIAEQGTDTTLTQSGVAADAKVTGDEIRDLKSAIGIEQLAITGEGKYIDLSGNTANIESPVTSAAYNYCLARCAEGDQFTVNATGGTPAVVWGFLQQNGTVIRKALAASHTETNLVLTAPSGSYYLVINDKSGHTSYKGVLTRIAVKNIETSIGGITDPANADRRYNLLTRLNILPVGMATWDYGSINNSTGDDGNSSTTRARSVYCAVSPSTQYKIVGTGYFQIHQYTSAKTYIGRVSTSWGSPEYTFTTAATAGYIRFIIKKDDAGTGEFDDKTLADINLVCYPVSNPLDTLLDGIGVISDDVSEIKNIVDYLPKANLMDYFVTRTDTESNGITFTWDANGQTCTVNGTSTGTSSDPSRELLFSGTLPSPVGKSRFYRFVVETESTDVMARLRFLDVNANAVFSTGGIAETKIVYAPNDAVSLEIRLQVTPGATINNKKITVRLEAIEETAYPVRLSICTYNIGCYNYGYVPSAEHPIRATSTIIAEMKEFFRTHNPDVFALQEGQDIILDSDLTTETDADTAIYDYLYPYKQHATNSSTPYAPSLFSKYKIIRSGRSALPTTVVNSTRPYAWAVIDICGILVYVMSVHLSLALADREVNYSKIESIVSNYDHWIVLGDFNAGNGVTDWDAQPEYTALTAHGWHSANGGWWGQFNTYAASTEDAQARRLDTVLTSSNIDINTYDAPYLRSSMPGDHRPLSCDLVIFP